MERHTESPTLSKQNCGATKDFTNILAEPLDRFPDGGRFSSGRLTATVRAGARFAVQEPVVSSIACEEIDAAIVPSSDRQ